MFRRRSKSVHDANARKPPPSEAVSAAALAAFKQQQSNSVLSSAAAAAALRSATSSPAPVGNVQTKRMARRNSNSSFGSVVVPQRPGTALGLQRQGSSGSMSERTFRSPSPNSRRAAPPPIPTEPVPPLPRAPPIPSKSHKRASSAEGFYPPASSAQTAGRLAAANLASGKPPPNPRVVAHVAARLSAMAPIAESRPERPASVNFSRPMSPTLSPTASPTVAAQTVFWANGAAKTATTQPAKPAPRASTSLGFSATDARNVERTIQKAANQPVKTKKIAPAAPGSHLAKSTAPAAAPASNTVASAASALVAATPVTQQSATTAPAPLTRSASDAASAANRVQPRTPTKSARPVSMVQASRPSDEEIKTFQARAAAMSARPRSSPSDAIKVERAQAKPSPATSPSPAVGVSQPAASTPSASDKLAPTIVRTSSVSPARSAHFSESPVLQAQKHEPPPRAISPMKSALKPSSRTASPASSNRDVSETQSIRSDEGTIPGTKKNKRLTKVSFDEEPPAVGQAAQTVSPASPLILSPQVREKGWPYDEDHVMTPRAALPSFGSVRDRPNPAEDAPAVVGQAVTTDTAHETGNSATHATPPPAIAVLPATPLLEDQGKSFEAASASPDSEVFDASAASNQEGLAADDERALSEGSVEQDTFVDSVQDQASEEEAEEEDADADGNFASLNAILESPVTEEKAAVWSENSPTAQPLTTQSVEPTATKDTDWNEAKSYWSSLSDSKKEELEKQSATAKDAAKKPAKPVNGVNKAAEATLPPWPDKEYRRTMKPSPSEKARPTSTYAAEPAHMRKSMRAEPEPLASEGTHMRKSMRQPGTMQPTMREPLPQTRQAPKSAPAPRKSRPTSAPVAPTDAVILARAIAAKNAEYAAKNPRSSNKLGRTLSNGSDGSESSFRKRRGSVNKDGRYSMAKSMRSGPAAGDRPMSPSQRSGRLSLRTAPPSESRNAPKRLSLRDTGDSDVRSLRSDTSEKRSTRFFGKSKSKSKPAPAAKPASRFSSRFADSSDEDDDYGPRTFRSRFADSDDEDDFSPVAAVPPPRQRLTPVRGIPRKAGQHEGDSTDLEDSDDEAAVPPVPALPAAQKQQANNTNVKTNGSAQGSKLTSGSLRAPASPTSTQEKKSKRSFFGFGRKSKTTEVESPQRPKSAIIIRPPPQSNKSQDATAPMVSPVGPHSPTATGPVSPSTPTRAANGADVEPSTPTRKARAAVVGTIPPRSEWPSPPPVPDTPPVIPAIDFDRPSTSDGIPSRPGLGPKQESQLTMHTLPESIAASAKPVIVSARTGKKKKFQGLRRALGIHD